MSKKTHELTFEDTRIIVERCTNGKPASCAVACPFGLDIRSFTDKCVRGKWLPAYKALRNEVLFPVIVSRLCDAPCQNHCQRSKLGDEPINLPALERAAVLHTKDRPPNSFVIPPREESLAVVGAGASGLALALLMSQKKYRVTVYDSADAWGGRLREHKDWPLFDEDITRQFSTAEVEFRFGHRVLSLDELSDFDAVYIATGSSGDDFGLLESFDERLRTTANSRVFLGGELCGHTLMEGIAEAAPLSRTLESVMQTGGFASEKQESEAACENYPAIYRSARAERVEEPNSGYSKEQAQSEGARCMQCDCAECMLSCELLDFYKKKPEKIAVEVYADTKASPPIATHAITRETYSCNQCGHCKAVCPENISMGELFSMSRADRMRSGAAPLALSDFWLREMDYHNSEGAYAALPKGAGSCEFLFFPGCQLGAYKPERVVRSYEFLSSHYNAGIYLSCCGAPAFWARDDERLDAHIEKIRETASALGNPMFVFACATCESVFSKFMPEIARISLYELLAKDTKPDRTPMLEKAAIFDPCAARENAAMQAGVRKLAIEIAAELNELPEKNRCCGYGGNIQLANPQLFDEIAENRAEMSEDPYVVYCANCEAVFKARGKECVHVLDAVLGIAPNAELPKIAGRRENSRIVKAIISGQQPVRPEWFNIQLEMTRETADDAERKFISSDDIKEAVYNAEKTGDKFSADDGTIRCCLIRPVFTYWVHYRPLDTGAFEILDAYCHRMSFLRED